MTDWTIASALAACRPAEPKVALRCEERAATYDELLERSESMAAGLAAFGAVPGDRIAVLCRNSIESVELFLAAARLGAVMVPVKFGLRRLEVDYLLHQSGARWLFADWSGWETVADLVDVERAVRPVAIGHQMGVSAGEGWLAYEDLIAAGSGRGRPEVAIDPEQPAVLRFGFGASELPLEWSQSQAGLLANARLQAREFELGPEERYLSPAGAVWAADSDDLSLAVWLSGGTVCLTPNRRFDPSARCAELVTADATVTAASPSQLRILCGSGALAAADFTSLRLLCVTAAQAERELLEDLEVMLPGCRLVQVYGHPGVVGTVARSSVAEAADRPGTAGRAATGCELAVLDVGGGRRPANAEGDVASRWDRPDVEPTIGSDGWVRTGDRGYLDPEGYLFVVESGTEVIESAGLEVCLTEVEATLAEHADVAEVAIVPAPSQEFGEATVAHLTTRPGSGLDPAALAEYARSRLAPYKVPVEWVMHETPLPRGSSGRPEKCLLPKAQAVFGSQVA